MDSSWVSHLSTSCDDPWVCYVGGQYWVLPNPGFQKFQELGFPKKDNVFQYFRHHCCPRLPLPDLLTQKTSLHSMLTRFVEACTKGDLCVIHEILREVISPKGRDRYFIPVQKMRCTKVIEFVMIIYEWCTFFFAVILQFVYTESCCWRYLILCNFFKMALNFAAEHGYAAVVDEIIAHGMRLDGRGMVGAYDHSFLTHRLLLSCHYELKTHNLSIIAVDSEQFAFQFTLVKRCRFCLSDRVECLR